MNLNKILSKFALSVILAVGLTSCSTKTNIDSPNETVAASTSNSSTSVDSTTTIIQNVSDLSNFLSLGCQAGTSGQDWLLNNTSNSTISKYKSNHDLINGLLKGTVDAIIIDELPAKYFLENNPQLQQSSLKFSTEEYAFAFKKGNDELRQAVNSTINSYKKGEYFQELEKTYMPSNGNVVLPDKSTNNASGTTIKVGTCADFYPFEYYDNNVLYGYDITLMESIASDNSWNIEFVEMDFIDLITALQNDEIDIVASGMSITDKRDELVDFSVSYFQSEQVVLTLQ